MDSILNSIKKLLGISNEETHFDSDLVMHINSVFTILNQLGVGPSKSFSITDDVAIWDDFVDNDADFDAIKTYMYLKVKLLFDPPLSSSVLSAIERQISELEWRLNINATNESTEEDEDEEW